MIRPISEYSIEEDATCDWCDQNPKFGINWGALGTVDNISARIHCKQLMEAIALVEKLNSEVHK